MSFPSGPEGITNPEQNTPDGWTTWSPRAELAPRFEAEGSTLAIYGSGQAAYSGAWRRRLDVSGGRHYHFTASFRLENAPRRCAWARLDWRDENNERVRQPDLVQETGQENGWTNVEHQVYAPDDARSVILELAANGPGTARWRAVEWREEPPRPERLVRAATIHHRPRNTQSAAESVAQFCRLAESAAPLRPDIICLPEAINWIGTGRELEEVCEPLPGPTTKALGAAAKSLNSYIVAGLVEREGSILYNTAVLIGRNGEIAGKYRKTHLPREEVELGLTPGDDYPVFQTDFGKIGIMICWDLQFPEPARALARRGAEIILLPIWGGSEVLAFARALENCVFLVSSTYDMRSFILDPGGQVLAEATDDCPVAVAELALDRPIYQPWIGDMRGRTWKERRPDLLVDPIVETIP